MKAIQPLLLSVSIVALACSTAFAGGNSAKNPGASAGASTSARYDFDKADKNKDGKVSRAEYDEMMKANASGGSTTKAQSQGSGKTADKPSTSSK